MEFLSSWLIAFMILSLLSNSSCSSFVFPAASSCKCLSSARFSSKHLASFGLRSSFVRFLVFSTHTRNSFKSARNCWLSSNCFSSPVILTKDSSSTSLAHIFSCESCASISDFSLLHNLLKICSPFCKTAFTGPSAADDMYWIPFHFAIISSISGEPEDGTAFARLSLLSSAQSMHVLNIKSNSFPIWIRSSAFLSLSSPFSLQFSQKDVMSASSVSKAFWSSGPNLARTDWLLSRNLMKALFDASSAAAVSTACSSITGKAANSTCSLDISSRFFMRPLHSPRSSNKWFFSSSTSWSFSISAEISPFTWVIFSAKSLMRDWRDSSTLINPDESS